MRLHRVRGDAERCRDPIDRQLLEVTERDAVALAGREAANGFEHALMLLRAHELIGRVGRDINFAPAGRAMAERYEAAPVVVTSQVQNDRPEVCRGPSDLVDAA